MKKIAILLVGTVTSLLWYSCTPKITAVQSIPPPQDTIRKPVEGIRGFLVLRPIDNIAKGNNKNYPFFYDFPNRNLDFTDQEDTYIQARNFLPEYITVDSLGRGVELQSMSAHPFSNFTEEVKREIALKSGILFENINRYFIADASNISLRSNSRESMQVLLNMLLMKNSIAPSISDGRILVDGGEGMLIMHPIKNTIKDINNKEWYVFYDFFRHRIYITDDVIIYEKFSRALPMKIKEDDRENAVLVQGISIDPFVYFNKGTLDAMAKEKGLEINGGKNTLGTNNDLNAWDILKLSNFGIVFDYKEVIKKLSEKLGSQTRSSVSAPATSSTGDNGRKPTSISPFPQSAQKQTSSESVPNQTTPSNGRKVYRSN
jgi:hypothetical protein